jgi:hypothetical protein
MLTIILTTSPVLSNPSTVVLETVVKSFNLVEKLIDCKLIIVCDGVKEISDEELE